MSATPKLKLTYFDMFGRAGIIRKVLTMGGVPFEDERVPFDLTATKPRLPYGKVPILEIDGQVVAESVPILRYVARLTGMYPPPSEPLAAAMIDELLDTFDDFNERVMAESYWEQDPETKKHLRETIVHDSIPRAFELIEKRVVEVQNHPFFQQNANKIYLHDVLMWDNIGYMRSGDVEHVPMTIVDPYKTLIAMYDKVEATPSIHQQNLNVETVAVTPPQLKLTYLDMPGRAEQIRLALAIGEIQFEDERLSREEFNKRKHEFPNAQVPVLEIDGMFLLAQSIAILRYVGSFTGLYPANDAMQALKIDEILSHIAEFNYRLAPLFKEQDPVKKQALLHKLVTTTIPQSLDSLNKRLEQFKGHAKTSFAMGGEHPTIADLGIHSLVTLLRCGVLKEVPTTIVDSYLQLLQSSEAVKQHPRVQAWYASQSQ